MTDYNAMTGKEEYDSPIWDKQPWLCPSPDIGLSYALKSNNYDDFIKIFGANIRIRGLVDLEFINMKCEGQCPKGCAKKFKLTLGKSITKKSFDKIRKHGIKYPEHCLSVNFVGNIKNGSVL